MGMKRINITMPEDILAKIDTAAEILGMNRSVFLRHAALAYITDVRNAARIEIPAQRERER